ncbi:hypothetical protein HK099_002146, partial [Clydaea vesicula]
IETKYCQQQKGRRAGAQHSFFSFLIFIWCKNLNNKGCVRKSIIKKWLCYIGFFESQMKVNTILAALVATTLATLYPKGSHDVVGRMSSGYAHKDLLPTRSLRAYSNNYSHKHSHYEHHDEYRPPSYRKKYYNKHHKSSYKKKKYHHHKSYLNSQDADDAVDSNSQDSDDENVHSKTTDHKTTDKSTEPETKKYSGSCVNYAKYSDLKRNCYAISCNLDPTGAAADQKCGKLSIVKQQFQAINAASADSTENAAVDSTGRQLAAPLESKYCNFF